MNFIHRFKHHWRLPVALFISFACVTIPIVVNVGGQPRHYQNAEGWMRIQAEDGRFSAYFPTKPDFASRQLQIASKNLNYQEYATGERTQEATKPHYSMWRVELPKSWKWAGAKTLLTRSLDVMIALENGELIEKNMIRYQDYPAIEFHMKQNDQEYKGRIVLVGSTLYKLMVSYKTASSESADVKGFVDSLTIYPIN